MISSIDPVGAAILSDALQSHITPNTVKGYASAFKKWVRYCDARDIPYFPATEVWICAYILEVSTSISQDSLKWYLSAIHYHQGLEGLQWGINGSELIRRTMRKTKRFYGSNGKGIKMPLSCNTLAAMFAHIPNYPMFGNMTHDDRLFVTASVIAVSAFLRGGEFLSYGGNQRCGLLQRDVIVVESEFTKCVEVSIACPKNMWWLKSAKALCAIPTEGSALPILPWVMLVLYREFARSAGVTLSDNGPAFVSCKMGPPSIATGW